MKTPTWATVIGILMNVFGGCSVMNDIKSITLPAMLEKQKSLVQEKMKEARTTNWKKIALPALPRIR